MPLSYLSPMRLLIWMFVLSLTRGDDSRVLEIEVEIGEKMHMLRFTRESDLVETARNFHDSVGQIHGMGCPFKNSQCIAGRLVSAMVSNLQAENMWDPKRHREALRQAHAMRFDSPESAAQQPLLSSQRYDADTSADTDADTDTHTNIIETNENLSK